MAPYVLVEHAGLPVLRTHDRHHAVFQHAESSGVPLEREESINTPKSEHTITDPPEHIASGERLYSVMYPVNWP